jgi:hypothetical protein
MKFAIPTLALATVIAVPAFAEPECTGDGPMKPMWETVRGFEDAKGTVDIAKMTRDGCYEIYGRQNGHKVEIYFDPRTGAELEREED